MFLTYPTIKVGTMRESFEFGVGELFCSLILACQDIDLARFNSLVALEEIIKARLALPHSK